ncbi:hypothetical protein DPMN_184347 [Dreissena polymorpha]|uniref:Uncharacterized protein n=1 Tax=Dreissena polymorpha TaxID=45954 RepID=A0A9D4I7T1_DREPO|nr:hypothetical protein DPMN_184347 [Dreissena polymorpha]
MRSCISLQEQSSCRHLMRPVIPSTPTATSYRVTSQQSPTANPTERFKVFYPCCRHSSSSGCFLAFFFSYASSIRSSHDTVSSRSTSYFVPLDSNSTLGRRVERRRLVGISAAFSDFPYVPSLSLNL